MHKKEREKVAVYQDLLNDGLLLILNQIVLFDVHMRM